MTPLAFPAMIAGKRTGEYCVAPYVRTSYHRTMTFWKDAKRGVNMYPSSQRELARIPGWVVAVLGR